jgi:hypothetical protein
MSEHERRPTPLRIEEVRSRRDLRRFIDVPWHIYRDDPNWVPPLIMERRDHLDRRKNPFFQTAEAKFWLALRGGQAVGRISAQVNRRYLERYGDATGHFGFIEGEDDPAVFAGLTQAAEGWLAGQGMERITGPFSLSINDEAGLLVEGFDSPPYMMMGHARPYYAQRLQALGYRPLKDLVTYLSDRKAVLPRVVERLVKKAEAGGRVTVRPLDMRRYPQELRTIMDIFNDAWAENWGFIPFSEADIAYLAKNIKPLIDPDYIAIAEFDGEPAAMAVMLPNLNEIIADLDGRLLPFGWAKLLWRLKVAGVRSARMPLMGVRRKFQSGPMGATLAFIAIHAVRRDLMAKGVERAELSWVLEENRPVRSVIESIGARLGKTYRIYEKALT